jgi:hypothetical protein
MNERIDKLLVKAGAYFGGDGVVYDTFDPKKFAELIVRECLAIARHREDELEDAGLLKESNAAGIVAYRIARQFGVKE